MLWCEGSSHQLSWNFDLFFWVKNSPTFYLAKDSKLYLLSYYIYIYIISLKLCKSRFHIFVDSEKIIIRFTQS